MYHYSAVKRNEIWIYTTWMNLQSIMMSKKKNLVTKDYILLYDSIFIKFLK